MKMRRDAAEEMVKAKSVPPIIIKEDENGDNLEGIAQMQKVTKGIIRKDSEMREISSDKKSNGCIAL